MRILGFVIFAVLLVPTVACDPVPKEGFTPPGGFVSETGPTGQSAIHAVLVTPSHGSFRTVREALRAYVGRTDRDIDVYGWYAEAETADALPHYSVAFLWHDGDAKRRATWELNEFGVWPSNDEARVFSVYPPIEQ